MEIHESGEKFHDLAIFLTTFFTSFSPRNFPFHNPLRSIYIVIYTKERVATSKLKFGDGKFRKLKETFATSGVRTQDGEKLHLVQDSKPGFAVV